MTLLGLFLYSLFFGLLNALIASKKGYDSYKWFWLGILLGAIATLILIFQPNKEKKLTDAPDSDSD